jgi:hypothetical protein
MRYCRLTIGGVLLVLAVSLGCTKGASTSDLVPVSGRVQMDRKPLVGATVRFIPENYKTDPKKYPVSEGVTDAEGRYTLKVDGSVEGAVPGRHKVEISIFERKAFISGKKAEAGHEKIPGLYNSNSKLSYNVPAEGSKEANFFDLHSDAGSGDSRDRDHR